MASARDKGEFAETLVWVGPWLLERRSVAIPELEPGALLLRVEATGICGTDRHLIAGAPPFPTVLGHEIAGEVVEFGPGTPHRDSSDNPLAEGDRVALFPWIPCGTCWACRRFGPAAATCSRGFVYGIPFALVGAGTEPLHESDVDRHPGLIGGFGEYLYVFPGSYFWRVPDEMPPVVAALLDPLGVAVRSVNMARTCTGAWDEVLTPDAVVVVQGAGPIGLLTALVLREVGVGKVIILGARPGRLAAARAIGADEVIDINEVDGEERVRRVMAMTGGRGADLVVDCASRPQALAESLRLVRRLGTVIEVGNIVNTGETIELDPATSICQKNVRLLGMSANPPRSYAEAIALLCQYRRLPFERILSHRFKRRDARAAIDQLGEPDSVKVVLSDS